MERQVCMCAGGGGGGASVVRRGGFRGQDWVAGGWEADRSTKKANYKHLSLPEKAHGEEWFSDGIGWVGLQTAKPCCQGWGVGQARQALEEEAGPLSVAGEE
eukprot:scaffold7774_cov93-Isochrysis_galbana.AAC.3